MTPWASLISRVQGAIAAAQHTAWRELLRRACGHAAVEDFGEAELIEVNDRLVVIVLSAGQLARGLDSRQHVERLARAIRDAYGGVPVAVGVELPSRRKSNP